jgi:hypothetical protein
MEIIEIYRLLSIKIGTDCAKIICEYCFPKMELDQIFTFAQIIKTRNTHSKLDLHLDDSKDPFSVYGKALTYFTEYHIMDHTYVSICEIVIHVRINCLMDPISKLENSYFMIERRQSNPITSEFIFNITHELIELWRTNKQTCIKSLIKAYDDFNYFEECMTEKARIKKKDKLVNIWNRRLE